MFILSKSLKEKIYSKINNDLSFCSIDRVNFEEVCSCKGGCGTYTPPCSGCAYD